jgi:hypothetical protein
MNELRSIVNCQHGFGIAIAFLADAKVEQITTGTIQCSPRQK